MSLPRNAAICGAALVTAALVGGCGGSSKPTSAACTGQAYVNAVIRIVDHAYAQGKLGSRQEIQRRLGGPGFFTPDGRLKPYAKLTLDQQGVFNEWMSQDKHVLAVTGKQQQAAQLRYTNVPC